MHICFAAASYAAWAIIYSTLRISPGTWVFQHEMTLNIPLSTDLQLKLGYQCWQVMIDKCLHHGNFCCCSCDYKVGDEILILLNNPTTLDDCGCGPHSIIQVHADGTVTFQRTMHTIMERTNIHNIRPFQR